MSEQQVTESQVDDFLRQVGEQVGEQTWNELQKALKKAFKASKGTISFTRSIFWDGAGDILHRLPYSCQLWLQSCSIGLGMWFWWS